MKKLLFIAISALSLSAYALPTYEPFTEFAPTIASGGITMQAEANNGTPLGTNANAGITNCLDLATGGYSAPGGEGWGSLNFTGTGSINLRGLDIAVISNSTMFTSANLSGLLPTAFPGFPAAGQAITNMVENPAQPLLYQAGTGFVNSNYCGSSAVLKFAQDITRPASGTKTLFVSYLLNIAQLGQTATGNNGRYLAFLSAANLAEGTGSGGAYTTWASLFNTFTGNQPGGVTYAAHGILEKTASSYYLGACDSFTNTGSVHQGLDWTSTALFTSYGTPVFVVGEYVLNNGANLDTNIVWMNPTALGGTTPPATGNHVYTMNGFNMSDLGGLAFIDRLGNGALGGVGTNYIANLIVGSTWSYVTGGPEFTTQPPVITYVNLGGSVSISGTATAAAQSVNYQWVKVTGGVTNNVNNGGGGAGGSATVSGAATSTLTLTGFSIGDAGNFQLVATAGSTGYILPSSTTVLAPADPQFTSNPTNTTANYGGSATFTAQLTTANAPLKYQWYKGSTPLNNGAQTDGSTATGATGTTGAGTSFTLSLTLSGVSYQDAGGYILYATNTSSIENSSFSATLAVNDPYIVTQPANPAVAAGGNATFTVGASGSPTLDYQWYENGTLLNNSGHTATGSATVSGATSSTLTLMDVQDADNGSYTCAVSSTASGQSTNSAAATLLVQDPLTVVAGPMPLSERVGDHCAFTVSVAGGGPSYQWYAPGNSLIAGATTSALILSNITTASNGTYKVTVQNAATAPINETATLTVINSSILNLSSANLVVARVGDGAQTLSSTIGNTIYLDQYTTAGSYVDTIQVPDEAVGSPYGTGSAASVFDSPALLVAGAGSDAGYEAMLTLSGVNQEYLGFAGYCQAYPFSGGSVNTQPGTSWRGLATVDAFGFYSLAYTNSGLYSGSPQLIHDMVTLDGTNFWTTGGAGAGTVKYVNSTVASYAGGTGVPSSTGVSAAGGRAIQIVNGPLSGFSSVSNLVVSDAGLTNNSGLWVASANLEPGALGSITFSPLLYTGSTTGNTAQPGDFAFSPDNRTVYVADSRPFTAGNTFLSGGIQRWDTNTSAPGWIYSYTLQPMAGLTNGAQGLTVDFSAHSNWGAGVTGAKLYATTYGATTNSLVQIVDNGAASTPTVLVTAGPNEALRGVRFGPALVNPSFANGEPTSQSANAGATATFSAQATGSGPLTYQWYFEANGVGLFVAINLATNSSYTINSAGSGNVGNYYVKVTNPGGTTAQSSTVSFSLSAPPHFISETYLGTGLGFKLEFTGTAGAGYSIRTSTSAATPRSSWTVLTTGTFSGGTDTYTDPSGGTHPQQFYIISVP